MAKSESAVAEVKPAPAETQPQSKPKVVQAEPAKPAAPEASPAPKQAEDVKPAVAPVKAAVAEAKKTAEKLKVEDAVFFRVDGKDKNGRAASFDFVILTNAYTWARGSTNQVVSAGKVIPETEVAGHVMAPKVLEIAGQRERSDRRRPCLERWQASRRGGARPSPLQNSCRVDDEGGQTRSVGLDLDARSI